MGYKIKQGDRVGAHVGINHQEKRIDLAGFGVFECMDHAPHYAINGPESRSERQAMKVPRFRILCPDGKYVHLWACEAWWMPEAAFEAFLAKHREQGYKIQFVDVATTRQRHLIQQVTERFINRAANDGAMGDIKTA
jgi:hypothetical protein